MSGRSAARPPALAAAVRRTFTFALIAIGSLALACDDLGLPDSWRIETPRVLALRVEVADDASRATPRPGERVRLRILVVGPDPITRLSFALAACPALPPSGDLPGCATEPFATPAGEVDPFTSELALEIELPESALEDAERVLVIGTVCTQGEARLPADGASTGRCTGETALPLTWTGHIQLARDPADDNHNPELASDAIAFDGADWPAPVPDEAPQRAVRFDGKAHAIRVDLRASGREHAGAEREALLLSEFTTAGELEQRFSVLESSVADEQPLSQSWNAPPNSAAAPDSVARFFFVLRDQRGGVAFTERQLALDP